MSFPQGALDQCECRTEEIITERLFSLKLHYQRQMQLTLMSNFLYMLIFVASQRNHLLIAIMDLECI